MDLNSYIQLKEAYSQVGKPQQLTESVDSIWEEVEAFAHALVEEEGLDLSDMTWDEVREAYLEEGRLNGQQRAARRTERRNAAAAAEAQTQAEYKAGGGDAGVSQRSGSATGSRARFNTKNRNNARNEVIAQGRKNLAAKSAQAKPQPTATKPQPTATKPQPTATKPQPTAAKPQPTATKPQPKAAKPSPSPMISDLKKRMPKPAAPKPSGSSLTGNRASSFMSKSGGAAAASKAPKPSASPIKSNRLRAALDSVKKEEFSDFDIILAHLIEQGFGDDEALTLMVNMTEEKREEILQLDELSKGTMGSYVKKAAKDVEKRSYSQGSTDAEDAEIGYPGQTPKDKKIDKRQKGISRAVGKMTRKEETDSLYQAYLSMMSEEECDTRKDKHQERGGHAATTDYSKPPAAGNDFGKKKPMSDEDRSAAMAKIVAKLKKQGGK